MDLLNFFQVLLKRKWLIIGVTTLAVVATFFIARNLPKTYSAYAQIATGITDVYEVALSEDDKRVDHFKTQSRFNNLIEIIHSRPVINLVSYQLILHDLTAEQPHRDLSEIKAYYSDEDLARAAELARTKLDSLQGLSLDNEDDRMLATLIKWQKYDYENLLEFLGAERRQNTDYVDIHFKSENPHLSAAVVNTHAAEFIRYSKNMRDDRSGTSVEFFANLVNQKKKELDEKHEAYRKYKQAHNIVSLDDQTSSTVGRINALEAQREEVMTVIASHQNVINNINAKLTGKEKSYLERQTGEMNQRYITLKNRLNTLNRQYISAGSNNTALADSIDRVRTQLEAEINNSVSEIAYNPEAPRNDLVQRKINSEFELDAARTMLASINGELAKLNSKVSSYASSDATVKQFERELGLINDEYLNLMHKHSEARLASVKLTNLFRQTEYGIPAEKPEDSKAMLLVAAAGIASMFLCIGVIFVLEYVDQTIRRPSQFKRLTQLGLLGSLNELDAKKLKSSTIFSDSKDDVKLETYKQSLRKLRYELELSQPKTVLFTSTKPNQGKTFTIVSLAYSLSLNDKKILIIDTNFKNNSLTAIYNAKPALEKYLCKELPLEAVITNTPLKGIDVIGCRGGDFSPSEVCSTTNFRELLSEVANHYDYVMMEGASLNNYADSRELAMYADKVIPIFAANAQLESSDKTSIEYIKRLNGKYMGSLLNKVELENLNQ
jgi:polysaccharide biosynthesis transport protein